MASSACLICRDCSASSLAACRRLSTSFSLSFCTSADTLSPRAVAASSTRPSTPHSGCMGGPSFGDGAAAGTRPAAADGWTCRADRLFPILLRLRGADAALGAGLDPADGLVRHHVQHRAVVAPGTV